MVEAVDASECTVYDVDLLFGIEIPPTTVEQFAHAIIIFITPNGHSTITSLDLVVILA